MVNPMHNFSEMIQKEVDNGLNVKSYYKKHSIQELKDVVNRDRLNFSVCLFNLTGELNVGSAMRTASILGAEKFIIFGRRKYDKRSTVGAQNYVNLIRVDGLNEDLSFNIDKFWETMNENNMWPVFIETSGDALGTFRWKALLKGKEALQICFVFGNETSGLPNELLSVGQTVRIPQRGVLRSLNVASAAAIVMWDYVKELYLEDLINDEVK